jgi:plastocyanin
MRKSLTTLLVASSLLGATALAGCGGDDDASTPPAAAAAATPAHTASHESAPAEKPAKKKPAAAPAEKPAGAVAADISGFAFSPANIEVEVGQEITWTNQDSAPHTVTATSGATFDSGTLDQGKSYTWKATKAGTVEYFCEIHPDMVGTITVTK